MEIIRIVKISKIKKIIKKNGYSYFVAKVANYYKNYKNYKSCGSCKNYKSCNLQLFVTLASNSLKLRLKPVTQTLIFSCHNVPKKKFPDVGRSYNHCVSVLGF